MEKQILDNIFDSYFALIQPVLTNISLKVIKQVRNPSKTPNINEFSKSTAYKTLLQEMILTSNLYGIYSHYQEIELQTKNKSVNFEANLFFPWHTGFEGAKEFFIKKEVVTVEQFRELSAEAKQLSFTVAKLTDLTVSGHLKDLITTAIDSGMDLKTYQAQVNELVATAGITPLKPYYIENVFRTNLLQTYNIGRKKAGLEDANTEGWRYVAVNDSRTREDHSALEGTTAKKNDPIWNDIYPPIDYQCRCSTIPISNFYAKRKGIKFKTYDNTKLIKNVGKDFRNSPNSLTEYDTILQKDI